VNVDDCIADARRQGDRPMLRGEYPRPQHGGNGSCVTDRLPWYSIFARLVKTGAGRLLEMTLNVVDMRSNCQDGCTELVWPKLESCAPVSDLPFLIEIYAGEILGHALLFDQHDDLLITRTTKSSCAAFPQRLLIHVSPPPQLA
jgi:hypothetical protein